MNSFLIWGNVYIIFLTKLAKLQEFDQLNEIYTSKIYNFRLVTHGLPKCRIFGNLSPFICKMWPSHPDVSFILTLESMIEPYFSYSLLSDKKSFKWVIPKVILRLEKVSRISSSYLTNVSKMASSRLSFS